MAKTKAIVQRFQLRSHHIEFFLQHDRKNANVEVHYEVEDTTQRHRQDYPIKMQVYSLWMNSMGNCVKAHCVVKRGDRHQEHLFAMLLKCGEMPCPAGNTMLADPEGIIRFGCRTRAVCHQPGTSNNEWQDRTIYDSKGRAMEAIIEALRQHRTIGGLSMANLSSVSDALLEEFGFEKIEDQLKRGIPLWAGSPEMVTNAGNVGLYQSHDAIQKNIQSFLELLQKEISSGLPEGKSTDNSKGVSSGN